MGEKWSPRRLQKKREKEREKQHHPLTHQKGIRFFLTPPKSKFVPLITTIHPPSVNMRWETWRKKEKVRERESVLLCVCFSFIFIYKINKLYKYLQKLSYPIPTLQSLIFFHSLFLIFFHGQWLWEVLRERERMGFVAFAFAFALNVGFRSQLSYEFQTLLPMSCCLLHDKILSLCWHLSPPYLPSQFQPITFLM